MTLLVGPENIANSPTPGADVPIATLSGAISTTPAAGTIETWTFSQAPPAALAATGQFRFLVDNEICIDVTGGGGTSRQVWRGAEGSTPATHTSGAAIYHKLTAGAVTNLLRRPWGRMTVFGDSLAADFGATITDWGASHKLGELLNAAPMRINAINGAMIARAQAGTNGDGGAIWVYQQNPRQDTLGFGTLLTNAPGAGTGATLSVTAGTGSNYAIGDVISVGGTTPEQTTVTAVSGDNLTATLVNAHAIGDPVIKNSGPYLPQEQLALVVYGINDLLNLGPDANTPTNPGLAPFSNALRAVISRVRCSIVMEDNYAGIVYGSGWSVNAGSPNLWSSGTSHSTTVNGSNFTILVPGDCPATNLVFGFDSGLNGVGALWTISASGGQFTTFTFDNRNANYFQYGQARGGASDTHSAAACRVAVPAANGTPYKITVTATTVNGTAAFDWFGIEAAPRPPYVLVTKENRPATINQPTTPYATRPATTLGANTLVGATSFTTALSGTTGWVTGDTVKIGTGATSDTLTVASHPTGNTFTTTTGATFAHSLNDPVQAGFQDADVTGVSASFSTGATDSGAVNLQGQALNTRIQNVINEFDSYVGVYDKDALFQRNPAWFITADGVHYNNQGHTELALALYNFLNSQAVIDTRELVSASVPNRRSWSTVGANVPPNAVAFQNSWTNYTGVAGYYPLQFYKDITTGLVAICGAVSGGTSTTATICTLPKGFRPLSNVTIIGESDVGAGVCVLHIDSSGNLSAITGGSGTFMSFYGTFFAEQ